MPGPELTKALIGAYKRIGATTRGAALVATANDGEVQLPAAANADKFMGFEMQDHADGDVDSVHEHGGRATAIAAGVIASGDRLMIADALGRLKTAPKEDVPQLDAGLVLAANVATLSQKARALVAVKDVTAGVDVGHIVAGTALKILPRGAVPAAGQCALSADGLTVNFFATDEVLTADIEYLIIPPRIVATARSGADAAGVEIAVNPVLGSQG